METPEITSTQLSSEKTIANQVAPVLKLNGGGQKMAQLNDLVKLAVKSKVEQQMDEYSVFKPLKEINRQNAPTLLKEYALLIWDGMGFFGFAEYKLERLQGKKVGFMSRFSSLRENIYYVMALIIGAFIIFSEIGEYGN